MHVRQRLFFAIDEVLGMQFNLKKILTRILSFKRHYLISFFSIWLRENKYLYKLGEKWVLFFLFQQKNLIAIRFSFLLYFIWGLLIYKDTWDIQLFCKNYCAKFNQLISQRLLFFVQKKRVKKKLENLRLVM